MTTLCSILAGKVLGLDSPGLHSHLIVLDKLFWPVLSGYCKDHGDVQYVECFELHYTNAQYFAHLRQCFSNF